MKRALRHIFAAAALAVMLATTGCVVVPARPSPRAVWVPAHWGQGPYGRVWVRGYWRP
ncbi:MAG: hypothetical protein WBR15_00225 [Gammaproteobacteria bacterium]